MPKDYQLYTLVVKNLEYLGYEVTLVLTPFDRFRYANFWEPIHHFIRKVCFNDREVKAHLMRRFNKDRQLTAIQAHAPYDYGLVFRCDFFDPDVLQQARKSVETLVAYHYDGLGVSPGVFERIPFFDRFFVFDPSDARQYDLGYATNFYFDYPEPAAAPSPDGKSTIYYLASFHESRNEQVVAFHRYAKEVFDLVTFEMVVSRKDRKKIPRYIKENMIIHRDQIPFEQHLERIKHSSVILDFSISAHRGYSFRVFEALKYKKKLITTNPHIIRAEFYHPHNIYLLDQGTAGIPEFLRKPYVDLPQELVAKYSFSQWVNRMFAI
ncbi:hypothetical protein SAMN05421747_10184 [Parapedobacter composti]|uniref:Glycosyltransferase family 9 (Heptosyltransferase) n=2 Tax=Parapedobacter composti TaxID=623281 RepID=A0A1I1DTX3_9SPHI|nr:hypothetical protein SAMN05421747_10184 [Parapedobacter composti]